MFDEEFLNRPIEDFHQKLNEMSLDEIFQRIKFFNEASTRIVIIMLAMSRAFIEGGGDPNKLIEYGFLVQEDIDDIMGMTDDE